QGREGRDAYRTCCCHHCIVPFPVVKSLEAQKRRSRHPEQPEEKPGEEVAKSSKGPPVFLKPKQKPPGAPQQKWSGIRFPTEQESTDSETYTSGSEVLVEEPAEDSEADV
ncbi:unnamed protein product, partial [Effrenium voratum]